MSEALWTLQGATLGRRLLEVTLSIPRGTTAVLGPSGAGKTSLLNLLVDFERPDAGTVTSRIEPGRHTRPVFWVPQDHGLWPHRNVREHIEAMGGAAAAPLLEEFDLTERADAHPATLSLGERARLALARALAANAAALVMDEPLAHVDPARAGKYWEALRRQLDSTGASLVFATHAPAAVLAEARHVICMKEARVLHAGAVDDLYDAPPTPELASCLGEANWLEPADAQRWLGRRESTARCLRPERLVVTPDGATACVVEASRFHGAVAEVLLRHTPSGATRRFWHRPSGNHLAPGTHVRLEEK